MYDCIPGGVIDPVGLCVFMTVCIYRVSVYKVVG